MRRANGTLRLQLLLWSLEDKLLSPCAGRHMLQALRLRYQFQQIRGHSLSPKEIHRLQRILEVCGSLGDFESNGGMGNDDNAVWSERAAGDDPQGPGRPRA
jgi:hypothetical protein